MQIKPYSTGRFFAHLDAQSEDFSRAIFQCRKFTRHLRAGDDILTQGQELDYLHIVPTGRVSMNISAVNGRRFQLGEVECDYQVFGEMEYFTGTDCQWSVVAEQPLAVEAICLQSLTELLTRTPAFSLFFASALAVDYQDSLDIYTNRLLHPITYNIAYDLLRRSKEKSMLGAFDKAGMEAERFGTTSRVYRRAVKDLIDRGLITKQGNEITVVDRVGLKAFVEHCDN
ncbi:Crp/Fnr family transcriptional regulator [Photobacterium aquae]|uniref:Crp/Fnr family transcriptional regulator n=1 Tax=Photobacterium aquae TaxID=1195763 RepID=A0A0J1GX34_9GAMM|nr:Crp/Fnr family transcriptional regulator [Photobacterium aquae]KLV04223.1 Crp/Fnr family transcriptional regulator [Photobacterium aquae]